MELTDDLYWLSKPPEVRALQDISLLDQGNRESAAQALANKGVVIDRCIDIWGWDPTKVMFYRAQLGHTSTLSAFTPPVAIKVSVDAADYPAYTPVDTTPAPVVKPVANYTGNGMYQANIQACVDASGRLLFADGQHFTQDDVEYVFHLTLFFGAPAIHWTKA